MREISGDIGELLDRYKPKGTQFIVSRLGSAHYGPFATYGEARAWAEDVDCILPLYQKEKENGS